MTRLRAFTIAVLGTALLAGGTPAAAQVATVDQLQYPPLPDFSLKKATRTVLEQAEVLSESWAAS